MTLDRILEEFETAWRDPQPPDIGDFLTRQADLGTVQDRRQLLTELVMVDLWHRWRQKALAPVTAGRGSASSHVDNAPAQIPAAPRIEDYLERYPELGPLDQLPLPLISEEYRARHCWADRPSHLEYYRRFPRQAGDLRDLLMEIDRGLAASGDAATHRGEPAAVTPAHASGSAIAVPVPDRIGKYHVVERIGQGGQATVYRAVQPGLAREVILKVARQPLPSNIPKDQLAAEARILSGLEHPHIARIYDLDLLDHRPYLVMEFVRGQNLLQIAQTQKLSCTTIASLVEKVARALAVAHAQGVIHQDLKPANILIDEEGEPRLIDFGLARLAPAWVDSGTEADFLSGTPAYMPPEQARGESQQIGPRSDLFGLGAVLFHLLTGAAPFADPDASVALERARQGQLDLETLQRSGTPRRLAAICRRALQARPSDRYASADEMADALARFARPRRRWLVAIALAAVFGLALAVFGPKWVGSSPPADSARAVLGRQTREDFPVTVELVGQEMEHAAHAAHAGTAVALVEEGQTIRFRIEPGRDCYVGIWHVDSAGTRTQLFPNQHEQDHFLAAGKVRLIPAGDAAYSIRVTSPQGLEYVHLVASSQRWEMPLGRQYGPYVAFASAEERARWDRQLRGLVLDAPQPSAVAEKVIVLKPRRGT